jgi:hypothetical protein
MALSVWNLNANGVTTGKEQENTKNIFHQNDPGEVTQRPSLKGIWSKRALYEFA